MAVVETTHQFNIPAEELWSLIGDFGDTGKWTGRPPEACRSEGEGIGALRTLTVADGRVIVDRLVDQGPLFYSYEIVSSPLPVSSYRATMSVRPVDQYSCEFTWSGNLQPDGISEEDSIALFSDIYLHGIAMMERQIERSGQK